MASFNCHACGATMAPREGKRGAWSLTCPTCGSQTLIKSPAAVTALQLRMKPAPAPGAAPPAKTPAKAPPRSSSGLLIDD